MVSANEVDARRRAHRLLWSLYLAVVWMPAIAMAEGCDLRQSVRVVNVGEVVNFGPVSVRLDTIEPGDPLDKYQISVKDNSNSATIANHMLIPRLQAVQVKSQCGAITIAVDRDSESMRSPVIIRASIF